MTVYKAFRNLIIALAIVGIIVAGSLIGFSAYRIMNMHKTANMLCRNSVQPGMK